MYTYAFLPNLDASLKLPTGIAKPVELLRVHELAALIEPDLEVANLQESDDRLMRAIVSHDRVIRQMFQQTALLPLRFGTQFVSQQGLIEHLQAHQSEYVAKLAMLKGRAEYLLKLVPVPLAEIPIAAEVKGKAYFLAKKQAYEAQTAWQQQQQAELQQIAEAIALQYPNWVRGESNSDAKGTIERFYILGDRIQERLLYEHFKTWQMQYSAWEISLEEPLPPYHFV
ncbi:MAG: GvpL/GvpF family gas vesicle protein [Oscillatoriophycideae cyanobacterium NC_groundwater_1537_Pr4_S-0.65um_50_18]|nr:GvpL/GvpF family gas vesicle protein [Oscillatoriophycideae cyanobacterium NC_groundwater_1537_Pr4_S-0.65um_50_18]